MERSALQHAVDHAAHLLPIQGPIGVFIHHNTLHAFQHLPFEEAVAKASDVFGTEPYMSLQAYEGEHARDRILTEDVEAVLAQEANPEVIVGRCDRHALRGAMLIPGLRDVTGQRAKWLLNEGGWLTRFRDDLAEEARTRLGTDTPKALWEACLERAPQSHVMPPKRPARPHAALFASHHVDLDAIVHPPLISLLSTFLDQGVAHWQSPLRNEGLLGKFRTLHGAALIDPAGLGGLRDRINEERSLDAGAVIEKNVRELGVGLNDLEPFITAELLALPGWAGMVRKLEQEPSLAQHQRVPCTLMDYLAVRLTLVVVALRNVQGGTSGWMGLSAPVADPALSNELCLFDVAQVLGLTSGEVNGLNKDDFDRLWSEITAFNALERRRVWHLAYERRHERMNLLPLSKHHSLPPVAPARERYRADVFFCIDEREESLRRALEEVAPDVRTYGAAGFFGCAIHYSGNDDRHGVDLCPVVVKPAHFVSEQPWSGHHEVNGKRQGLRQAWAAWAYGHNAGSRNLLRGWVASAITGFTALVPLVLRSISPLFWSGLNERLSRAFLPHARTTLDFHRVNADSKADNGLLAGFTVTEMADRVGGMLNTVGLTKNLARNVVFLGHGSTSLNNPHESAHDCGACGGRRGGANGRLFAAMANHPEVRTLLKERGISIADDVWFIGGYHDTCNDDIDLLDLDHVPAGHVHDVDQLRASLNEARAWSAHERARRFEAAGADLDASEGLRHVRERASHLAEPRPEYGHCTNAVCIVGRRETTRGLFFDRRAFLVSYDAHNDPQSKALAGVLGAVIPVCGGISLEYYFSFVDNEGHGCGTKLPHNVTGLIGVMNGYQGDLRTGLPWQMVEIHEPVRILFIVETTPERLMPIIDANAELSEFVKNRWIRISTMDPDTGVIQVHRDGKWEELSGDEVPLPRSTSSAKYYSGTREHLPVARIEPILSAVR